MKDLQLSDLHNPNNITEIFLRNGPVVGIKPGFTAFQELKKSVEIWEKMPDGRLLKVVGFNKSSISYVCYNHSQDWEANFEPYKP